MKVMSFVYTKAHGGSSSQRTVAVISEPTENVFGIDISSLDIEDQGLFLAGVQVIDAERKASMDALMKRFDITHNFRSFKPNGMSEIVVDE